MNKNDIKKELNRIWDDMINDPQKAFEDAQLIEQESINQDFPKGILDARFYKSWCLIYLSRLKEAIEILSELSARYSIDDASEDYIKILNALGVAYQELGDNNKAFHYYSQGLKLCRLAGLKEKEVAILGNLGSFYLENENFQVALNHYNELLLKINDDEKLKEVKSNVIANVGQCHYELGNYDESEKNMIESKKLSLEINDRFNLAENLFLLAKINFKKNKPQMAKELMEDSLKLAREVENKKLEIDLLIKQGKLDNDVSLFHKAYEISDKFQYKQKHLDSCKILADYYEIISDFKKALQFLKEHNKIEKELNSQAAERKFQNLEMEYEIERSRKNAELFKTENLELKESLNWMTLLYEIARDTMSSLDIDKIFNKLFRNINLLMDVTHFHIVLLDKENDILNIVKAFDNGIEIKPFAFSSDENSSFAGWAIKNKKELLINDIEKEYNNYVKERAVYGEGPLASSILTVPVFLRNNEMGAVAILSYHKNAYTLEHVQFLKSLAAFVAIAIDNSKNFERMKELNAMILAEKEELTLANAKITELATHDILTGLINRRVLFELLDSAMEQSKRRKETLAVLYIDLDDFKPINDNFGHDCGDKVLIEIARRLKESVRTTDSVARIGGDEFLILLHPVKNETDTELVTKKIMNHVSKPMHIEGRDFEVEMSIGISIYDNDEISAEQLIINADIAMYKVKKSSKKGISFFERHHV